VKYLRALDGRHTGKRFVLEQQLVLGRGSGCDVIVSSTGTSRKHAIVLVREDGHAVMRDLASRNGTLVDGTPTRQCVLQPGARVQIGEESFLFELEGEAPPTSDFSMSATFSGVSNKTTLDHGDQDDPRRELVKLARSLAKGNG